MDRTVDIWQDFSYCDQQSYPENQHLVVFLDGYNLSKGAGATLERPYDPRFGAWMKETFLHFLQSPRYCVVFGFTMSDELFLLLSPDFISWKRRPSHVLSILTSECAVTFDNLSHLGCPWEAKVFTSGSSDEIIDFLCVRRARAVWSLTKNHLYYYLRQRGMAPQDADAEVRKLSHRARLAALARERNVEAQYEQVVAAQQQLPGWRKEHPSWAEYAAAFGPLPLGTVGFFEAQGVGGLHVVQEYECDSSIRGQLQQLLSNNFHAGSGRRAG